MWKCAATGKLYDGDCRLGDVAATVEDEFECKKNQKVQEVSMRQAKLQLHKMGLLDLIDKAIEGLTGESARPVQIEWSYASCVSRTNDSAQLIMKAINFTEEQVDQFFEEASKL